jgi:hypothetical protein
LSVPVQHGEPAGGVERITEHVYIADLSLARLAAV